MSFSEDFEALIESLPGDWTDLEIDLRIDDQSRYVDTAVQLSMINAQPYSGYDWQWRLLVAGQFGHAAAAPAVHGVLKQLDESGVTGELRLREVRQGRAEIVQVWGRPESARQEFRRRRAL